MSVLEKKYRWASPHEWLFDKVQEWPADMLLGVVYALAGRLDADSIQDLFQDEMDRDDYFTPTGP